MFCPLQGPEYMEAVPNQIFTPAKRKTFNNLLPFVSPDKEPSQQRQAKVARLHWTDQVATKEDEGALLAILEKSQDPKIQT